MTENYKVLFTATSANNFDGGSVTFNSDYTGEFWYKLKYEPIATIPVRLFKIHKFFPKFNELY
jgi:hypothetical protein